MKEQQKKRFLFCSLPLVALFLWVGRILQNAVLVGSGELALSRVGLAGTNISTTAQDATHREGLRHHVAMPRGASPTCSRSNAGTTDFEVFHGALVQFDREAVQTLEVHTLTVG